MQTHYYLTFLACFDENLIYFYRLKAASASCSVIIRGYFVNCTHVQMY